MPPDGDDAVAHYRCVTRLEVQDQTGVLVHAQDPSAVGHLSLECRKAPLAQVAVTGVVVAALGIVVMGDDRDIGTENRLQQMARGLEVAEGIAPTHPHKTAPESAIGNMLVGPFVSMIDRVRDAIRDATS